MVDFAVIYTRDSDAIPTFYSWLLQYLMSCESSTLHQLLIGENKAYNSGSETQPDHQMVRAELWLTC